MNDYEVWFIGVANEKARFVELVSRLKHSEAKTGQFFAVSDISIVLVAGPDAYISRSGVFCGDNNDDKSSLEHIPRALQCM